MFGSVWLDHMDSVYLAFLISSLAGRLSDLGSCLCLLFTGIELLYQLRDSGARAIFVTEDTLGVAQRCCEAAGIPVSNIFVISLEEQGGNAQRPGSRTLRDLTRFGERDWERMDSHEQMQSR